MPPFALDRFSGDGTLLDPLVPNNPSGSQPKQLDTQGKIAVGCVFGGLGIIVLVLWICSLINKHRYLKGKHPLQSALMEFLFKLVGKSIPKDAGYASRIRKRRKGLSKQKIVNVKRNYRRSIGMTRHDPSQWGWGTEGVGDEPDKFSQDYGHPDRDNLRGREINQAQRGGVPRGMGGRLGQTTQPRTPQRRGSTDGTDDNAGEGSSRMGAMSRGRPRAIHWAISVNIPPTTRACGRGGVIKYGMRGGLPDPLPGGDNRSNGQGRNNTDSARTSRSRDQAVLEGEEACGKENGIQEEPLVDDKPDPLMSYTGRATKVTRTPTTSDIDACTRSKRKSATSPADNSQATALPATPMSVMLGSGLKDKIYEVEQSTADESNAESQISGDGTTAEDATTATGPTAVRTSTGEDEIVVDTTSNNNASNPPGAAPPEDNAAAAERSRLRPQSSPPTRTTTSNEVETIEPDVPNDTVEPSTAPEEIQGTAESTESDTSGDLAASIVEGLLPLWLRRMRDYD